MFDAWSDEEDDMEKFSPMFISSFSSKIMTDRFQCVIHHESVFVKFNRLCYKGLKEVWEVDPDSWSYFEVLSGLKDLEYLKVENYIEEPILSLENNVGSNEKDEECEVRDKDGLEDLNSLEDDNLDDLNNGIKGTFDDLGTFEDLNNLSDKFDEGGITCVEDANAIDQKSSCKDVNLEGTTKGIDQKDSCEGVTLGGPLSVRMK
ncbi:hypothetical protein KIW84_032983 [Lathyrus oleraceus]|uniref:PB1-like domain-containing protein n=1 Tax=Pisum sativum TaxID=3888 RepID=A0A9D4XZ02_PEA|nr:hypothetical protein KIW84_032983 [Pisum sativum]